MSHITRRSRNHEELPRPIAIPIRALNARGHDATATLWTLTDDVYVLDSLDLQQHHGYSVTENNNGGRVNPAATQDSIGNLERFRIEGAAADSDESLPLCSICLGVLSVGSEAIRMPHPCSHVYHHHCITKWLNMSNTCPLCRRTI